METTVIRQLFDDGTIVIALGGGGIPVAITLEGRLKGVEAVVDKDWSSSLLAIELDIERMLNLTAVDHAKLDFGSPVERNLEAVTAQQAKTYLSEGHFLPGSMAPKIESALHFLESGGSEVVITSCANALAALEGKTGTHLLPDG